MLIFSIIIGVTVGCLMAGYLHQRYWPSPDSNAMRESIKGMLFEQRMSITKDLNEALEENYVSYQKAQEKEKRELNLALKATIEELVLTLQTIRAQTEASDIKIQESTEWAIRHFTERFNQIVDEKFENFTFRFDMGQMMVECGMVKPVEVIPSKTDNKKTTTKTTTRRPRSTTRSKKNAAVANEATEAKEASTAQ